MLGTNYPAITPKDVENFRVPKLDSDKLSEICNKLESYEDNMSMVEGNYLKIKDMKKTLVNTLFV